MLKVIIFLTIFYATDLIAISKDVSQPQNKSQSGVWNHSRKFWRSKKLIRSAWTETIQIFQNVTNQIKKKQSEEFVPICKEICVAILAKLMKICACLREKIKIIWMYILDAHQSGGNAGNKESGNATSRNNSQGSSGTSNNEKNTTNGSIVVGSNTGKKPGKFPGNGSQNPVLGVNDTNPNDADSNGEGIVETDPNINGKCGMQPSQYHPLLSHRIINSREAKPNSWPWQVVVYGLDDDSICGGTILRVKDNIEKSDAVLTAAHCIADDGKLHSSFELKAGVHDEHANDEKNVQVTECCKALIHPKYEGHLRDDTEENDIALIFLKNPFQFSDTVQPVCLPDQGEVIPVEKLCVVTGWGLNNGENGNRSSKLQQLQIRVLPANQCPPGLWVPYTEEHMICVGDLKADVCEGDSGGPLQCKRKDDRWTVYGVVSNGPECDKLLHPGFHTRVSAYVDWINEMIGKHSEVK